MSDIVERLRRKVFHGPTMEAVHTKTVEWQAADEIERLRNELYIAEQWSARVYAGRDQDAAEITRLRAALSECEAELNAYYRMEYPGDHPHSQKKLAQAMASHPATIALKENNNDKA